MRWFGLAIAGHTWAPWVSWVPHLGDPSLCTILSLGPFRNGGHPGLGVALLDQAKSRPQGGGLAMVLTVPRTPLPPTPILWLQAFSHLSLVYSQSPQHLRPSLTLPPRPLRSQLYRA